MCTTALKDTFSQKANSVRALWSGVKNVDRINCTLSWGVRRKPFHIFTLSWCCSPDATHLFIAIVQKEGRSQGHWDCTDTAQNLSQRVYSLNKHYYHSHLIISLSFWVFWHFGKYAVLWTCLQSVLFETFVLQFHLKIQYVESLSFFNIYATG